MIFHHKITVTYRDDVLAKGWKHDTNKLESGIMDHASRIVDAVRPMGVHIARIEVDLVNLSADIHGTSVTVDDVAMHNRMAAYHAERGEVHVTSTTKVTLF